MYPIYFIESLDKPNGFYRAVEEEIQKLPSNYITHETYTVAANQKAWTVTGLLLKNVDVVEDTTSLEQARKKEGVFNFGLGPYVYDGKPRIVFSLLRREQLHYDPLYPKQDTQKTILGTRCVHIGDSRIPLEYAVSQMLLSRYRKSLKPQKAVKSENPIFLLLLSYYKSNKLWCIPYSRIVTAGASLPDFLQLKLYQNEAFFCRCQEKFDVKYVKVVLEEHTWCKVLSKVGFKVQEEVREATLRDEEIYFTFRNPFKFDGSRFSTSINDKVFECNLPNIGPSFISDDCARTYTLRTELTFHCTTGKCSSTLSSRINLDVAIEDNVSTFKPLKQPQRVQTLLFFDKIPMTPNIVQNVASYTALRTTNVPQCLGHQTCSLYRENHVVAVTAVFLSEYHKTLKRLLSCKSTKPGMREYAMVKRQRDWALVENINGHHIDTNLEFHFQKFLGFWHLYGRSYYQTSCGVSLKAYNVDSGVAYPGLDLDNFATFKVTVPENQKFKLIGLRVELLQKKIRVLPGGLHNCKTKSFKIKKYTPQSCYFNSGTTQIDGWRYRCKIPNVEPTILSNGLIITYELFVYVKLESTRITVSLGNSIHLDIMSETSCLVLPPSYDG